MSTSYETTFEFLNNDASFDIDNFFEAVDKLKIPVVTERCLHVTFRNDFILKQPNNKAGVVEGTETFLVKTSYNSHMLKEFAKLAELIPKPYQVTSGDDLEGEWVERTEVIEAA